MNEHIEPDEIANGPDPRSPKRGNRRTSVIGLVAVGGLAAGGAALYVANSAGAAPSGSPSSATASSPSTSAGTATCAVPGPRAGGRPGGGPGTGGGLGPGGRGPAAGADGRITAVSSTSLTVRDLFGTSHTYKITSATVIHSGPARSVQVTALSVGANVVVRTSSSTSTAAEIDLRPARIDGSVSAVTSTAITVTDRDGFTRTIDTDAQTKYTLNAASSSRAKVSTRSVVHAEGKVDANGTALDAATVDIVTAAKAPAAGSRPCSPAGHGPGGPGHRGGGPGAPKPVPSGSSTPTPPARPTPSTSASK